MSIATATPTTIQAAVSAPVATAITLPPAPPARPRDPELDALKRAFPIGSWVTFRSYHPAIWPFDWRRRAEREPWGLRRGDTVQVVGYGADRALPEALVVRRPSDGAEALVFPPELQEGPGARTKRAQSDMADLVVTAAEESFPASDPPAWVPVDLARAA